MSKVTKIIAVCLIGFIGLFLFLGMQNRKQVVENIEDATQEVLVNEENRNEEEQANENTGQSIGLGDVLGSNQNGSSSGQGSSNATRPPVAPGNQDVNKDVQYTATLLISMQTLVNNMDMLSSPLRPLVPANGFLMARRTVTFLQGESVFDVLNREVRASNIHMVVRNVPAFNSVYIESIGNIGEFDAGPLSGWVYKVNGWGPNFGASQFILEDGDVIEWHYTLDLGRDVGVEGGN